MTLASLFAISGPQKVSIFWAPVMDLPASKSLCPAPYINSYYVLKFLFAQVEKTKRAGWARKTCQYRSAAEEKNDVHVYRNKARNPALKRKILPSLFREEPAEGEEAVPPMSKAAKVRNMCCFAKLYCRFYFWTLIKIQTCSLSSRNMPVVQENSKT